MAVTPRLAPSPMVPWGLMSRTDLLRRGVWLTIATVSWNVVDASIWAGALASSVALVGFGIADRGVGVHRRHGRLDDEWRGCVIVEKLLGKAARD